MTDPTERQAAALALPSDDWPQAIARARRLLAFVVKVEKMPGASVLRLDRA